MNLGMELMGMKYCDECGDPFTSSPDNEKTCQTCEGSKVIRTLQALRKAGAECWIWSGRSDECKAATVEWLQRHGCFGFPTNVLWAWPFGAPERFRMRKAGDYTPDDVLKESWYDTMSLDDKRRRRHRPIHPAIGIM